MATSTGADVLRMAIEMARAQRFACPYCAIAAAHTELTTGRPLSAEELRQFIAGVVEELPEDAPLVEARRALLPFVREIQGCPSAISQERMVEMLMTARLSIEDAAEC